MRSKLQNLIVVLIILGSTSLLPSCECTVPDGVTGLAESNYRSDCRILEYANTRDTAIEVSLPDDSFNEYISSSDEDWYSFNLTSVMNVTIYSAGSADTFADLYDSDEMRIVYDHNSGEDNNFRISETLEPGTYYVRVLGLDFTPIKYTFVIRAREVEHTNSFTFTLANSCNNQIPAVTNITARVFQLAGNRSVGQGLAYSHVQRASAISNFTTPSNSTTIGFTCELDSYICGGASDNASGVWGVGINNDRNNTDFCSAGLCLSSSNHGFSLSCGSP